MTAEHEGRSGLDALMAAITDEPLPDEAHADAAFLAEHRSAAADVALLREQLGIIGRALSEPAPVPEPRPAPGPVPLLVRPSRTRRRSYRFAFGALAVTAVASVVTGTGWLLAHSGTSGLDSSAGGSAADSKAVAPASGTAAFGSPGYLACARLVVEGEVTAVEPVPGTGQERIALRVTRSYVPEKSQGEVTFLLEEDFAHKGEQVLVGIPRHAAVPDVWVVGERDIAPERAWITASLPEARKLTCE